MKDSYTKTFCNLAFLGFWLAISSTIAFAQQTGIIYTERSSPTGIVSFSATSKLTGIANVKHIDGYVKKYGTGHFTFPVGHKGSYRPFVADADGVTGAYFLENPAAAQLPAGAPFAISAKGAGIKQVNTKDFWDIDGENASKITLTWKSSSGIAELTANSLTTLTIVGWNASVSKWEVIGSMVDEIAYNGQPSTFTIGSITSQQSFSPNKYKAYTFAALSAESSPAKYAGALEVANCSVITGWTWDENHPDAALSVELVEGSTVIATGLANILRDDLKTGGIGTGKYGYRFVVPSSLVDGRVHEVGIRIKGTGNIVGATTKTFSCKFESAVEVASCYEIKGWGRDVNYQDSTLTIELLENNVVKATVKANIFRQDLQTAGKGTGKYGFRFPFPSGFQDGLSHELKVRVKGVSYTMPGSDLTLNCPVPQYGGSYDAADCNTIRGWVWDKNYPESAMTVELLEGNTVLGTMVANIYREAVKTSGFGTGKYGFSFDLPAALRDGQPHALSVRVKGTTFNVDDTSKTVTCGINDYIGRFESVDCNTLRGYIWDKNFPDSVQTVEVMEGTQVVATSVANLYRDDRKTAGFGDGYCGFAIALPASLKDGRPHQLSVRVKGSNFVLVNSPLSVSCAPLNQYAGRFESVDCNVAKGWAWNTNYPATAVIVEIMEGTTVRARDTADIFRQDLKDNGIGTGKYGFSIALPAVLKDGQAHELSIRVRGTTILLTDSPRTLTCSVPSAYDGNFDAADCSTVRGWVWDKSYPDAALTVELLEGSTVRATTVANIYKEALMTAGYGTGKYGFSFVTPASLKDGQAHQLKIRVKGSSFIVDNISRSLTCAVNEYAGKFESADCNTIKGWAWDNNFPDVSQVVELYEGSTVYATVTANVYREDRKTAGNGAGNVGFSFALPSALKDGQAHQLSVRIKGTSYILTNSPFAVTCATPNQFAGHFESVDCSLIKGWAWNANYPETAVIVEVLEGSTVRASATADIFRQGLLDNGTGTGKYGFSIALPAVLKDGQPHALSIRIKGTTTILTDSPRTLTCAVPSQYGGTFEGLDCSTVRGWVWDKSYPDAALTVELIEGTTVYATSVADIYREDRKTAGFGTGMYGFSFALPMALKDGQAHQLSIRVKGTTYILGGASKSVTCAVNDYIGRFESVDCNTLRGYIWDKNFPNTAQTVEVMEGSQVVATSVANVYRDDRKVAGFGDGYCGFAIALPASLKDGQSHQLSVRVKSTNFVLTNSPLSVSCAPLNQYAGRFESLDCNLIKGWAWNTNYPATAVIVEIMEGTTVRARDTADIFRQDLKDNGIGTGKYGFSIALPAVLKDGQAHELSIRVRGTTILLTDSPRTLTCSVPSAYDGNFDAADCSTVRGWVWDKSYPDAALTVELLEGSTVRATTVANIYKEALMTAGYGTGKYGFSFVTPASLKDGQAHQLKIRVKGSSFIVDNISRSLTCAVNEYAGKFESADCNTIKGWAWDNNFPDVSQVVELYEGSTVYATVTANVYREDRKTAGNGAGNVGFSFALPSALKDGQAHQLSVRIKGTSYILTNSPFAVTCATPNQYAGHFESVDCSLIKGWAWNANYPETAVIVEVLEGSTVRASATADIFRQGLLDNGTGTGKYGFSIALPAVLKDGQPHALSIRIKGTTTILTDSPRTLTCAVPSQYGGTFEGLDCSTVRGWVWDKSYPDAALTVELIEGTTVYATSVADIYREDRKTAGFGTGMYGFSFALPMALKDGQAHQLSIRVKGTTYILGGASKSVTCAVNDYIGRFESVDCNTLRGYIWDKNFPNTAQTVEVMEGSQVVATSVANVYRDDRKVAGFGDGYCGFAIALPASLKDGQSHQLSVRVKSTNFVLTNSPLSVSCAPLNQYAGRFESLDCNLIKGWAWNTNYPATAVIVEIMEGTTVRARDTADIFRQDLKDNGIGTGKYGFSIALPAVLKDGQAHELSIRVRGTTILLTDSPRTLTCSVPSAYDGNFDAADCSTVRGWVWDKSYPDAALTVELLEGSTVRATTVANIYKEALMTAGYGTGKYGFSFVTPASLKDGQAHQLRVRVKGSSFIVDNATKSLTCAVNEYSGKFESADCNLIKGWAWDKNFPDVSQVVELYEGSTVYATVTANVYREDRKTAGNGAGNVGFSFALPSALKDGQAHQLSVRIKGTSYILTNSPFAVTCATPNQFAGHFESVDCSLIKGWAWNANYPETAVIVEVLEGSTVRASATADIFRQGLLDNGTGTGKYGFSIALPAVLKDGQPHALSIRIKGTTTILTDSPRTLTCAVPSQYTGRFESLSCSVVKGWVWDKSYPDSMQTIELFEGTTVYARTVANVYREDRKTAGFGTGYCGFSFPVPNVLKDGQAHQLSVRIKGTSFVLTNSPLTLTCSSSARTAEIEEAAQIEEVIGEMVVAPNPTSGKAFVNFESEAGKSVNILIINLLGRVIWKESFITTGGKYHQMIDLSQQPSGVYIIQLHRKGMDIETKAVVLTK